MSPKRKERVYCWRCDGCGWYEGGKTLQTKCEVCAGTGVLIVDRAKAWQERTPVAAPPPETTP